MTIDLRNPLQVVPESIDGTPSTPGFRARKRRGRQIMLSRYLKDPQRHEMLACNCPTLPPSKDIKALRRNLTKVLPELAGVGAWCQRD
ncbi:hypothetical protein ONS95_010996 [Cadophora gregata]|uniref:uncharacterized protein n=1 Tax=Cadophora gregata TaxID=51156 RepID=UPI0026DCDACB|nr:uncharacterized protein ONS95_010996 [Cadophora gregata]KAK0119556.1 hypothetical protein ONS95_010996 [Cadophora gregata]